MVTERYFENSKLASANEVPFRPVGVRSIDPLWGGLLTGIEEARRPLSRTQCAGYSSSCRGTLLFALVGYFFGGDAGGFGVEVGGADGLQVFVEGVLQRDPGGYV